MKYLDVAIKFVLDVLDSRKRGCLNRLSETFDDGKYRVVGYFTDLPTLMRVMKECMKLNPKKKYNFRFQLFEEQ